MIGQRRVFFAIAEAILVRKCESCVLVFVARPLRWGLRLEVASEGVGSWLVTTGGASS